ncbi:MAG: sulfatase [Bacteroidales bacterium]|nr:sulfatase [Bacteroidales bacterium]
MKSYTRQAGITTILSTGVLALSPSLAASEADLQTARKPNVILILLDDFGYTDLACYGSRFYETPNIDRLAAQGIRFTNAYASCPVSSPTRAALMTGRYPVSTGITDWIPGRQATKQGSPDDRLLALPFRLQLEREEITIAETLKNNGYATMISGKWHLGTGEEFWPEFQGFDVNSGGHAAGQPNRSKTSNGFFSPYGNPRLADGPEGEYLTDRQTDEAIKFIESSSGKPFFVFLSYYAVHNPMQAKEEHIRKFTMKADSMGITDAEAFTRDREWINESMSDNFKERIIQSNPVYAAMIYSVDENIGRLVKRLGELNLDDNTIIIFTSDNGGLSTSEGSPTCNYPLRAGKGWLYEGGIRVPLIIKYPGFAEPGIIRNTPAATIDLFPTITELTGSSDNPLIEGVSLVPLFKSDRLKKRPLFWHYPHYSNQGLWPGSAVRLGKYKLIDNFEKERQELYDLESDLSETTDISGRLPAKTKKLYKLLTDWREKHDAQMMIPNPAWKGAELQ